MQDEQKDVVILFCDICDFDKIIASKGRHIVEILDELFRKYDGICLNHGLQKIEVIKIIIKYFKMKIIIKRRWVKLIWLVLE